MFDDLYTARVLSLAANLPHAGRLPAPQGTSEKVAKLCGSRVVVDVVVRDGRVAEFAQDVKACALGQAAAGILGQNVVGASLEEVEAAREGLRLMLKEGGPPPAGRFAELAVLAPVKDYPQRHASTMLAFEAVAEAARRASETAPIRQPG